MKNIMSNVRLAVAIICMAGILAGCGGDNGSGPGSDPTRPTVTLTDPADGATGVIPNRPVQITFSESMDEASLDSIYVEGVTLGRIDYDDASHSATLWLAEMLEAEAEIEVRVAAAVQDLAGNEMESDHTFSFTTGVFSCGGLYDPFEDNDEIATAKDVALNTRYWLVPSCGGDARYDYYRFTLTDPAKATVRVNYVYSDTTHTRWGISFFRENGDDYAQIGYDPVPFPQELSFYFSFMPGTYYALIYEQDGSPFTGIYNFIIEISEPCEDDDYEDNDFEDEAKLITADLHEGLRGCYLDSDFFKIEMAPGKTLKVTMTEVTSVGGTRYLNIWGPGVNAGGGANQTEPRVEMVLTQAGTYYIQTRWWADGVTYDLNVEVLD